MSKQTEALKLALEALETCEWVDDGGDGHAEYDPIKVMGAIATICQALAEQPKESPKFDPNESFAREEAAQARVREFMRNH